MDRSLFIAMNGAKQTLLAQTANANNLANSQTTGFKADLSAFQARQVVGDGYASRVYATASSTGFGVVKSGSPMPSEMTSFIVAAISKNLRMPEGFSPATRFDKRCTLVTSCIETPVG